MYRLFARTYEDGAPVKHAVLVCDRPVWSLFSAAYLSWRKEQEAADDLLPGEPCYAWIEEDAAGDTVAEITRVGAVVRAVGQSGARWVIRHSTDAGCYITGRWRENESLWGTLDRAVVYDYVPVAPSGSRAILLSDCPPLYKPAEPVRAISCDGCRRALALVADALGTLKTHADAIAKTREDMEAARRLIERAL